MSCWGIPSVMQTIRNFCLNSFKNGSSCARWGNVNHGGIWLNFFFRLENRVENWQSQMDLPSFTGGHSTNHVSSIIYGLFSVESSLLSGKALADNFSGFRQFHIISSGRIGAPPGPNSRLGTLAKKGDRILAEAAMF